jgi:GTP cyclohydrolase II
MQARRVNAPNSIPFPVQRCMSSRRLEKPGKIVPDLLLEQLISPTHRVQRAAGEFRRGAPVLIETKSGLASLAAAAETVSQPMFQALRRSAGTGFLMITHARAATLKIPLYTDDVIALPLNAEADAHYLRAVADPATDLDHPLKGPFHVERKQPAVTAVAAVRLAKLAGLLPAAILFTLETTRGEPHMTGGAITAIAAEDILEYPESLAESLQLVVRARVPLKDAEAAELVAFRPADGGPEHYAILIGDKADAALAPPGPVLARLHSECFTGDLLASLRCDCGDQLRGAIKTITASGGGVLLYLAQEGRGIGLMNKLRAYRLQDEGYDTLEANRRLGFEEDERLYEVAARMLRILGFQKVRLLTNNPQKMTALQAAGIEVVARAPHHFPDNIHNREYLRTKATKAGHLF